MKRQPVLLKRLFKAMFQSVGVKTGKYWIFRLSRHLCFINVDSFCNNHICKQIDVFNYKQCYTLKKYYNLKKYWNHKRFSQNYPTKILPTPQIFMCAGHPSYFIDFLYQSISSFHSTVYYLHSQPSSTRIRCLQIFLTFCYAFRLRFSDMVLNPGLCSALELCQWGFFRTQIEDFQ